MTDCPNAEIRDLLPDLVHGRLDAGARADVERHVLHCAECAAEVALLRELRSAFHVAPRVDVAAIIAAVPRYRRQEGRSWIGWRTAATITALVAGGSSVAVLQRGGTTLVDSARSMPVATAPSAAPERETTPPVPAPATAARKSPAAASPRIDHPATRQETVPVHDAVRRELAVGGGAMNDLNDRQLTSLLKDIESLDGLPTLEVDNAALAPIAPGVSLRRAP
jgi:anti-sigma factor RsiW